MLSQIIPLGNLKRTIPKTYSPGVKKTESRPEKIQRKGTGDQASNQEKRHKRSRSGLSKYA